MTDVAATSTPTEVEQDNEPWVDLDVLKSIIEHSPNELYNLIWLEPEVEDNVESILDVCKNASTFANYEEDGTQIGENYVDLETYADLLERILLAMLKDMNAIVQWVAVDKITNVTGIGTNDYRTALNNAPFWKIFNMYFLGIDHFRSGVQGYTSEHEINRLNDGAEVIPSTMQQTLLKHLADACFKQYGAPQI